MVKYAKRMDGMRSTAVQDLLGVTKNPEIISFAGGMPAPELFPVEEYLEACQEVLTKKGEIALQYGAVEGYEPLKEKILERMEKVGVKIETKNILITSGSQQGLEVTAQIFINPGDTIITESPTYLGALDAFKPYEPNFVNIEMDDEGMRIDKLREALEENDNVKFIYVIPDFQNPTGKTWSLERRKEFLKVANEFDIPVVEDNPYGELRFKGEFLPSLQSLDTEGRVIFLGTFSKTFAPGIRIGWVSAEEEITQNYLFSKQGMDLGTSTISQLELTEYLDKNDLSEHVAKMAEEYEKRKDFMVECMKKEFPEGVEFTNPDGGLFLWVTLPGDISTLELYERGIELEVAFVPGVYFYPHEDVKNALRLNYSNMPTERIEEGIKRLGKLFKEALEEK